MAVLIRKSQRLWMISSFKIMDQQDRLAPWEVQISTATCSFNGSQVAQADEQAPHHRKRNTAQKEGRQQVFLGWLAGQYLGKSGNQQGFVFIMWPSPCWEKGGKDPTCTCEQHHGWAAAPCSHQGKHLGSNKKFEKQQWHWLTWKVKSKV